MENDDPLDKMFDKLSRSLEDQKYIDHFRKFTDQIRRRNNLPPIDWYKPKDWDEE